MAATKPGLGLAERLTKTAPGAFIYPLTGEFLGQSPLYPKDLRSLVRSFFNFQCVLWKNLSRIVDVA